MRIINLNSIILYANSANHIQVFVQLHAAYTYFGGIVLDAGHALAH